MIREATPVTLPHATLFLPACLTSTVRHILVGSHCQLGKRGFILLSGGIDSNAGFPPADQRACDGAVLGTTTSPADGNALEVTPSL